MKGLTRRHATCHTLMKGLMARDLSKLLINNNCYTIIYTKSK